MLESFNNKCLRCIVGITKAQQHIGHITSAEERNRFEMKEVLEDVVIAKRPMAPSLRRFFQKCPWHQAAVEGQSEEGSEAVWNRGE